MSMFVRTYGAYETTYVKEKFDWIGRLSKELALLDAATTYATNAVDEKASSGTEMRRTVFREHLPILRDFNSWLQAASPFENNKLPGIHTTCLCCLHHAPEIVMPCCQQLICMPCAREIGYVNPEGDLLREKCPYHDLEQDGLPGDVEILARLKPVSTGLRVLSLDG
jgi:hypothetical protein